jgi:hypothetical protein
MLQNPASTELNKVITKETDKYLRRLHYFKFSSASVLNIFHFLKNNFTYFLPETKIFCNKRFHFNPDSILDFCITYKSEFTEIIEFQFRDVSHQFNHFKTLSVISVSFILFRILDLLILHKKKNLY